MEMKGLARSFCLLIGCQLVSACICIALILHTDGWGYVIILFAQTILTILCGILLANRRDKVIRRDYFDVVARYGGPNWGQGSPLDRALVQEARRRGDHDTVRCVVLLPVTMGTCFAVDLLLVIVYTLIYG